MRHCDDVELVGGDDEVQSYSLGKLNACRGTGGDLILVAARRGRSDVGVSSAAAAGVPEGGCCEEAE